MRDEFRGSKKLGQTQRGVWVRESLHGFALAIEHVMHFFRDGLLCPQVTRASVACQCV